MADQLQSRTLLHTAESLDEIVVIGGGGHAKVVISILRKLNRHRILGYTDQPNVSMDFNHDSHSSIFHLDQTKVVDGSFVRVLSWYDNEWGFSNRMADTAVAMAKLI